MPKSIGKSKISYNPNIKFNGDISMTKELFQMTLNITVPWYVEDLKFYIESKGFDIYADFTKKVSELLAKVL